MENDKNKADQEKAQNDQGMDQPINETTSDSDFYKRTMIGTGKQKSDENFDGTFQQSKERDQEDRDNNDGDANTENNY